MAEPIIDAHHHIWRRGDLPWLDGPIQPRIFGDYTSIRRDYPVEEFLADLAGTGVAKSVYVQPNWAPERYEEEAAWVSEVAAGSGWPHAIVAYADMLADDLRPALDRLATYPLVCGIRYQLHWHDNPLHRFADRPDLMNQPAFRRNVGHLADRGWSFDLQIFASQMTDGARLAGDFPGVTFILQHCGMPEDLSDAGLAAWREGMKWLAAEPNVVVKLSALGTFIRRNDPAHIGNIVGETVSMFGPDRCLFGSNFPIEKLWTSYAEVVGAYRDALAGYSDTERRALFWNTAQRVYRIAE